MTRHAGSWEGVAFRAEALAIQKELHGVAVRKTSDRDDPALLAVPVPVRLKVEDRLLCPDISGSMWRSSLGMVATTWYEIEVEH